MCSSQLRGFGGGDEDGIMATGNQRGQSIVVVQEHDAQKGQVFLKKLQAPLSLKLSGEVPHRTSLKSSESVAAEHRYYSGC